VISVLTVDLQYDFFDVSSRPNAGRLAKAICLPAVRALLQHARRNSWKVVHVVSLHEGNHTLPPHLLRREAPPYCIKGTDGAAIIDDLHEPGDVVVEKRTFDGFSNPELADTLQYSDQVIICGVATDCCVLFTAHSAANTHAKQVFIPYQAAAASTIDAYLFGLQTAAKSIASVIDIDELLSVSGIAPDLTQVPVIEVTPVNRILEPWFREKLDCVSQLQHRKTLPEMPIREVLKLLEEQPAFANYRA